MDKSNRTLVIEARTILFVLHRIVACSYNWDEDMGKEDMGREDMVRLLYMARLRLDALVYSD